MNDPKGRNFDLYLIDIASKQIEQVTHNESFDGFPMFTHDGKRLVFASNRNGKVQGETNIFVADWK
jgi:Tol biopolymer transport system component